MPKVKLTYFAGRGRGEIARLLLAAGGVEYENVRIPIEDWAKHKEGDYYSTYCTHLKKIFVVDFFVLQ